MTSFVWVKILRITCKTSDILTRFREAGLKLNPTKCHFCKASVTYMAHVVSKDGLVLDPAHSQKVRDWPTPKSATEV